VTAVGVGEIRNNNGDGDVLQHGISFERGKNTESLTENRCIALDIIQIDRYLALEVQILKKESQSLILFAGGAL